jgi:hypothetical protein
MGKYYTRTIDPSPGTGARTPQQTTSNTTRSMEKTKITLACQYFFPQEPQEDCHDHEEKTGRTDEKLMILG